MKAYRQKGFAAIELVLIVVVVAVIAVIGTKLYSNRTKQVSSSTANPATSQASEINTGVVPAPNIVNASDLDKAQQVLNQNDPSTANNDDSASLNQNADF
jgi:Tfp pilus assembly major pilin PilA